MPVVTLRVSAVRKQNPTGIGGAIFSGKVINEKGDVADASSYIVVKATDRVLAGAAVEPGQWWRVVGDATTRNTEVNGFRLTEQQIDATEALLLRPSGEHLVTFLADSPAFEGIGVVKARRLWDAFGEQLYSLLDSGDVEALSAVLTPQAAQMAVAAWSQYGDTRTMQWLHAQGFDVRLGRKVVQYFGTETASKLEEDPYRLLSFAGSWKAVDNLARGQFKIPADDPRRLLAAIEEACYRLFAAGHTSALTSTVMDVLKGILGSSRDHTHWRSLATDALRSGLTNGSFIVGLHGVQPLGAMAMERVVAKALAERIVMPTPLLPSAEVDALLAGYEAAQAFQLNDEQRQAVHMATAWAFCCITGGAGVGKTTVLQALFEVFDNAELKVVQLALAGRASKRMAEATGRPAFTIATFLKTYRDGDLSMPAVVVIDEASMTDIVTMSRVCEALPAHVRLVLVGDPNQLMPVGPGLVLHAVAAVPEVPSTELKVVKRYGNEIASAAAQIRDGKWPLLQQDGLSIAFVNCATDADTLARTVFELYAQDPDGTQILSSRRNGPGGIRGLNALCQERLRQEGQALTVYNDVHESLEHTGFFLGDVVLCVRNLWDRGLQNGSLGRLVEIEPTPRSLLDEDGSETDSAIAWVEWDDGIRRPLVSSMLDDLELGYAITVHKAQGSQWPRVVIPVTRNRLLDRTLLYTAVTRAQVQVILVGDEDAAREATCRPPRAQERSVCLDLTLSKMLAPTGSAHGAPPAS